MAPECIYPADISVTFSFWREVNGRGYSTSLKLPNPS